MNLEGFGMDDARMIVEKLAIEMERADGQEKFYLLSWPAGLGGYTISDHDKEALALKLVNAIIARRALYGGS